MYITIAQFFGACLILISNNEEITEEQKMQNIIFPNWPAPSNIQAFSTTRRGGVSQDSYISFNLGLHVGDDPRHVMQNRLELKKNLDFSTEPLWLQQIHGREIINANDYKENIAADGCYSTNSQQICIIMAADCLPILLTNRQGNFVMALHAGWRGLAAGIIKNGIALAKQYSNDILVWLGPAIGQDNYEVGNEVKDDFSPEFHFAFKQTHDRWLLDLAAIAKQQLKELGISGVYESALCTYANKDLFFSYRRDGKTGRMATGIWIR